MDQSRAKEEGGGGLPRPVENKQEKSFSGPIDEKRMNQVDGHVLLFNRAFFHSLKV